jgi:predicted TIM-barrel fold metal-dependent hydrolase
VIDAHVHLFPDRLFDAIWKWFDEHAWVIRDKLYADPLLDRLERSGVTHVVGLLYAHRPGISDELNRWLGDLARRRPLVLPCATAHPLDDDLPGTLQRACEEHGARLVKQHCHVLGIAPDDPRMFPLYETCIRLGLPLNLHAGNGPKLPGYAAATDAVSGLARTETVLRRYPELRLIVPHLGCMEQQSFLDALDRFPNLYLDTSMALAPFAPGVDLCGRNLLHLHPGRILFGTDFPNIPYDLATERSIVEQAALEPRTRDELFHGAAARLLGLSVP